MMIPETQDTYVDFSVRAGILIATYRETKTVFTLEIVESIVARRLEIQKGKEFPVLIIGADNLKFTAEAREYLSSEKGMEGISTAAILARSWAIRFLANVFLRIRERKISIKVFRRKTEALRWLQEQMENFSFDELTRPYPPAGMGNRTVRTLRQEFEDLLNMEEKQKVLALRSPQQKRSLLTKREQEIACLIREGLTSYEIGIRLFIDVRTVEKHREHIRVKTGATSPATLIKWMDNQPGY